MDPGKIAELIHAAEDDTRKTRKFDPDQLRALGVVGDAASAAPPTATAPATPKPVLVVIERYRKPPSQPPIRPRPLTRRALDQRSRR